MQPSIGCGAVAALAAFALTNHAGAQQAPGPLGVVETCRLRHIDTYGTGHDVVNRVRLAAPAEQVAVPGRSLAGIAPESGIWLRKTSGPRHPRRPGPEPGTRRMREKWLAASGSSHPRTEPIESLRVCYRRLIRV